MKNKDTICKKIKFILPALLLLIFLCAIPGAAASSYELVANTTSDENGDFIFEDVPNGDYSIASMNYLYSAMAKHDMWFCNTSNVNIEGSNIVIDPIINRLDTSVEVDQVLGMLQKKKISGVTLKKGRKTNTPINDTTLILISDTGELVANTTSDQNGSFYFTDIPNGNYNIATLNFLYSSMSEKNIWYTNTTSIELTSSDIIVDPIISSKDKTVNVDTVLGLLDRSEISGTTLKKGRKTNTLINDTTLVLVSDTGEFVANTTSDQNGSFYFTDIQNGNYNIASLNFLYSSMSGENVWYTNTSNINVSGSNISINPIISSRDKTVDVDAVLGFFDRSEISGITLQKGRRSNTPVNDTIVVLLKEKMGLPVPTANFSINNASGNCPLTVEFNDLSENATSWYWDFGDGSYSTDQNPIHVYDSVGSFSVKLTASNTQNSEVERKIDLVTSYLPVENKTKKMLFLVLGAEETYMTKQAVKDMGMEDQIDVYGSYRENRVEIFYSPFEENISMEQYNVVFVSWKGGMSFLGANLKPQIWGMINETKPGTFVYDQNFDLDELSNIEYINHTEHPYLEDYWMEQYDNNIIRLITYLSVVDLSSPFSDYAGTIRIEEPSITPTNGIVHPDAGYEIFNDLTSYLEWYSDNDGKHHVYNPENYTVGITFFEGHDGDLCDGVTEALINELESRGINVIPTFRPAVIYELDDAELYFKVDKEWKADAFIDVGMGVSSMSSFVWQNEALQEMGVPVINGIQYQGTIEEWENSVSGQDGRFQYQIPIMEIGGEIESIVIGGKEYDEDMEAWTFQPIDYQMKWMVDRTVGWIDLQHIKNKDKRVAIIYYNHGKQGAMVAANLDVAPSIPNMLTAMKGDGYDLDEKDINRSEFIELVLQQGRNVGVWAPGELNYMVENYDVELLPVETYLEWFEDIEPAARQSVIDTWGEAPGKGMVYENESGKYFVFPKIEVGNVLIAPQPPRGLTINDTMLYHDQSVPPSHNYIAFYLWLNKEQNEGGFDTDAVVHFGRHGSEEWLQGKGVGLSVKECWPALLIQDMPVVYLYDVGGVGEGITAKRRGNAVMVDHLTAPVINSGLYGNLTQLHDAMHNYEEAEGSLKQEYRRSIINYYEDLDLEHELGNSSDDLFAMENETFENFVLHGPVHDYLHEIASSYMPYGLHILGEDMSEQGLTAMVKSMLGNDFKKHVNATGLCEDPDMLSPAHSPNVLDELLTEVLINGTEPMEVVIDQFNIDYTFGQYYTTVLSNTSGSYDAEFVKDGKYTVYAFKEVSDGWITGKDHTTIVNGETVDNISIALSKNISGKSNIELEYVLNMLNDVPTIGIGTGVISGQTCYPGMDGSLKARSNSKVVLQKDGKAIDMYVTSTDANYTFSDIPDGEYVISSIYQSTISGSWYFDDKNVEISNNGSEYVKLEMEKDNANAQMLRSLLGEVSGTTILNGTSITEDGCSVIIITRLNGAQLTVANDLYAALDYSNALKECKDAEINGMIDALNGKYIPPALGDDPTRSPDEVLPTGKNFYAFNPNIVPTKESWEVGKQLVDEFLDEWKEAHDGQYPEKVGFVLWSSESMRHKGVMEAEIMYLLGVEPDYSSSGKVEGVKLIPEDELGRPRIDVLVTMTGVYRDNWKWQVQLMDRAVRLAADAESGDHPNYVKDHSDTIYDALMETGNYGESEARGLSMCRLFGPDDGSWGIGGLTNSVDASGTWTEEEKLANLYINSMSYAYGDKIWAFKDTEVFKQALADTDAVLFSRSGNSGRGSSSVVFDHTYEFFGGFGMAVRNVSGDTPDMFIVNLKDSAQAMTETLGAFLSRDLRSTYWNPTWIEGMMNHGYVGASEIDRMLEDFWGLNVMLPDEINDDMWNEFYNIYENDKYELGMDEWFQSENSWAKQSMEARMLEAIRKGYWDAPDEVLKTLAQKYQESVVENGVSCCHHTCGNPLLHEYVSGLASVTGYTDVVDAATKTTALSEVTEKRSKSGSGTKTEAKIVDTSTGNQTHSMDGGVGSDMANDPTAKQSEDDNYVEGYEMVKEKNIDTESSSSGFSGADMLGTAIVFLAVGIILYGFRRRGF